MYHRTKTYRTTRLMLRVACVLTGLCIASCDLLNQTPVILEGGAVSAKQAPADLSAPDSTIKMLVYVFDRHTPETARQFADLLYDSYVYRYDDPTDENDLELDRASEIRVHEKIFSNFETISVEFFEENRWLEYGSGMNVPLGTTERFVSEVHPTENWIIVQVVGDMEFTNMNEQAQMVGYRVSQRFELGFRLAVEKPDSTWQLASWTDRESFLSARVARYPETSLFGHTDPTSRE